MKRKKKPHEVGLKIPRGDVEGWVKLIELVEGRKGWRLTSIGPQRHVLQKLNVNLGGNMSIDERKNSPDISGSQMGHLQIGEQHQANQSAVTNTNTNWPGPSESVSQKQWEQDVVAVMHALTDRSEELGADLRKLKAILTDLWQLDDIDGKTVEQVGAAVRSLSETKHPGLLARLPAAFKVLAEGAVSGLVHAVVAASLHQ